MVDFRLDLYSNFSCEASNEQGRARLVSYFTKVVTKCLKSIKFHKGILKSIIFYYFEPFSFLSNSLKCRSFCKIAVNNKIKLQNIRNKLTRRRYARICLKTFFVQNILNRKFYLRR